MSVILAKKIYQDEHLIFARPGMSAITSDLINNDPTQAWLVKNPYCCGGDEEWQLEFTQPASLINTLNGVWIQQGADGFLIDGTVADVVAKLGGCCGTNATVVQNYPNGLPVYQAPVAKTFTVTHTGDDGSIATMTEVELSYIGQSLLADGSDNFIPNSFSRSGYNSGTQTGTYVFQAYNAPVPNGTDVIVQTARVFTSNTYGTALSGPNVYHLTAVVDGQAVEVRGGTSFASLVTALQADAVAGPCGTWSTSANTIILTTTVRDAASLVVGQEA